MSQKRAGGGNQRLKRVPRAWGALIMGVGKDMARLKSNVDVYFMRYVRFASVSAADLLVGGRACPFLNPNWQDPFMHVAQSWRSMGTVFFFKLKTDQNCATFAQGHPSLIVVLPLQLLNSSPH
jgi:hypothetical protein